MNSSQVAEVGRGMREVARNTGMTGKEIKDKVSSLGLGEVFGERAVR